MVMVNSVWLLPDKGVGPEFGVNSAYTRGSLLLLVEPSRPELSFAIWYCFRGLDFGIVQTKLEMLNGLPHASFSTSEKYINPNFPSLIN